MIKKLFIVLLVFVVSVWTLSAQNDTQAYVKVNGYASVQIEPNIIRVNILINERDSKGKESLASQERVMISTLKALGIDTDSNLFVENFSGTIYRRNSGVLSKVYSLKLTDSKLLNPLFESLQDIGINNVQLVEKSHTDIDKFRRELRSAAVLNAKSRAEDLAGALGQHVGKALTIEDYSTDKGQVMLRSSGMAYNAMNADPGLMKITIEYNVQISFELK